jgi:hypothetical protein
MGEIRSACNILVGKPEGKRPHRSKRPRWENNIRMDLRKGGWEVVEWSHLAQDRDKWQALVKTIINFRVP